MLRSCVTGEKCYQVFFFICGLFQVLRCADVRCLHMQRLWTGPQQRIAKALSTAGEDTWMV